MAAPLKDAKLLYANLSVYDRTFIETFQSLVNSGNYAPGPLVMDLTRDAVQALMVELGYALPVPGIDYDKGIPQFNVWIDANNPRNQ